MVLKKRGQKVFWPVLPYKGVVGMIISREGVFNQILEAIGKIVGRTQEVTEDTLLAKDLGINLRETPGLSSFIWNVEQSLQVRIPQISPPFTDLGGDMVIRDLIDWIMEQLEAKEGLNEYGQVPYRLREPVERCEVCDDNYYYYAGCMGMCPDCLKWVRNFPFLPNHIKKVAKAVCDTMEEVEPEEEQAAVGK